MNNSDDYSINEIHAYELEGIPLKTGDLICTVNGSPSFPAGQFWWLIGKLIPGEIDHIAVYIGPEGRCVEAGAKAKVITFDAPSRQWDPQIMFNRRYIMDNLYGIANPIAVRDISPEQEEQIRLDAARYCLMQAEDEKPYNLNFIDSDTEEAFYCSQLAYKAYIRHGINLNTEKDIPNIPFTEQIVFPQEVWGACNVKQTHNF